MAQFLQEVHFQHSSSSSHDNSPASQVNGVNGHMMWSSGSSTCGAAPGASGGCPAWPPPSSARLLGRTAAMRGEPQGAPPQKAEGAAHRFDEAALDELLDEALSGGLMSKGSAKHKDGKCRPCHYIHTSAGCASGKECRFCHMPHTGQSKSRLGASKRNMCKQIADAVELKLQGDPEGILHAAALLGSRSHYLRSILEERVSALAANDGSPASATARRPPGPGERQKKIVLSL